MKNTKEDIVFEVKEDGGLLECVRKERTELPSGKAKSYLEHRMISVDDTVTSKFDYPVKRGQTIKISQTVNSSYDSPLEIIYEDSDLLAINKPAGLLSVATDTEKENTAIRLLRESGIDPLYVVHRIDRDTSGLLMVAKNDIAHQSLAEQLKNKTNTREYWAIVHGQIAEDEGTIDAPIARNPQNRQKQAIVQGGKNAVTHFKVIKRYQHYTLISCRLETGRTHQIRVHMQYIKHPVAGDPLYGPHKTLPGNGQYLHAKTLGFEHPRTHEQLLFDAPLPDYFDKMIKYLDEHDS